MDQLKFYSDKKTKFKCNLSIDGASLDETQARLVLRFDDLAYLVDGEVDGDSGDCLVTVPALGSRQGAKGEAVLEVIADEALIPALKRLFEVVRSKTVSVKTSEVKSESRVKVSVDSAPAADPEDTTPDASSPRQAEPPSKHGALTPAPDPDAEPKEEPIPEPVMQDEAPPEPEEVPEEEKESKPEVVGVMDLLRRPNVRQAEESAKQDAQSFYATFLGLDK